MGEHDSDFAEFAAARWDPLVRAAVFLGCRPHEAQDMVQATLVKCFRSWSRVVRAGDRDGYVYRMLVNTLRDSQRRFWRREVVTGVLPERLGDDPTADLDVADAVERALRRLSPAHRQVLVLRYLAGLSEQQTAEALGVPLGTVKSRAARALTQLSTDTSLSDLAEGG